MRTKGPYRLSTALTLLIVGAVVPLLAFASLTLVWLTGTYRASQARAQADTTRALALAVDAEVRSWRAVLFALAAAPELRDGRLREFDAMAREVAARYDGWVVVNDASGQQHVNTLLPFGTALPHTTATEMVQAVFRDGRPITDLVFGAVAQRHIVSNSVPVMRDGRVVFCLSLNLGPERLTRLLGDQKLPATWITGVADRQIRVVARVPHRPERLGQPMLEPFARAFRSADQGSVESTLTDGRRGRVAFERLREAPWVLWLTVPSAELESAWRTPLLGFLAIGAVLTLLALALATLTARWVGRPVQQLAEASERMLRGEQRDPGPPAPIRELQQLREAFIEAAAKAQGYYREHERASVAEETAKVAAASADALRDSETRAREQAARVQALVDGAPVVIWIATDPACRTIVGNRLAHAFSRTAEGANLSKSGGAPERLAHYRVLHDGVELTVDDLPMQRVAASGEELRHYAMEFRFDDGTARHLLGNVTPILDAEGRPAGAIGAFVDVTELRQTEVALRAALREKEAALADNLTLVREVHHRVKNNLQMLCDLMYLQMETMENREEHQDLQDAYSRVYAIARLHEQLYQSMQRGRIKLDDYLRQLAGGFESLYPKVAVTLHASSEMYLDLDRAIHAGLVVNELITNAVKHGFVAGQPGQVTIGLRMVEGQFELEVRDNGRGLPANLDIEQSKSLGLRIVHLLTKRLQATLVAENKGGACFTVRFPAEVDERAQGSAEARN